MKHIHPNRNNSGQSMIEAAIALPLLLMLFVGMIYFHARSFNQARSVIAARHACWLASHGKASQINTAMTNFFHPQSPSYKIDVSHKNVDVKQPMLVRPLIEVFSLLGYKTDKNPKVTFQYTQAPSPIGIMIPPHMRTTDPRASLDFMWTNSPNLVITILRTDHDTWSGNAPWQARLVMAGYVGYNL